MPFSILEHVFFLFFWLKFDNDCPPEIYHRYILIVFGYDYIWQQQSSSSSSIIAQTRNTFNNNRKKDSWLIEDNCGDGGGEEILHNRWKKMYFKCTLLLFFVQSKWNRVKEREMSPYNPGVLILMLFTIYHHPRNLYSEVFFSIFPMMRRNTCLYHHPHPRP